MSTLNGNTRNKMQKRKIKFVVFVFVVYICTFPYLSYIIEQLLSSYFLNKKLKSITYIESFSNLLIDQEQLKFFGILSLLLLTGIIAFLTMQIGHIGHSDTVRITDKISIPKPVGEGQFGTARFLSERELKKTFSIISNDKRTADTVSNGGIVVGQLDKGKSILYVNEDIHTILIAATRSGKTRRFILPSIWLRARTGRSMVITDPKGELFLFTQNHLKSQGYKITVFDLRQPRKSDCYNFMDLINNAVDNQDIPQAIDYTWDLVSTLVGVPKGEPLWSNGESAVIAASIMVVAMEAEKEYRNLTNVYYFIVRMCKEENGIMPINEYFLKLPETHPARGMFAVAELSPDKMRGSFFGSALATLRLFTNWNIADITSKTEIDIGNISKEKTALFIIVPDEKTTLYPLASLFVSQIYIKQVEMASLNGGRLEKEIDFFLDEFGNFPTIPNLGSMLSAGAGRGLRFNLVLQDFQQLEKHYKNDFENIKGNCVLTIYLKTPSYKTLEELSKRTGKYTVQTNSVNSSQNTKDRGTNLNYSNSANMQGRELLLADELGRMDTPYAVLFYAGSYPAVIYSPDLTEYAANTDYGMGNKEQNQILLKEREEDRKENGVNEEPKLWSVCCEEREEVKEKVSFLDLENEDEEY